MYIISAHIGKISLTPLIVINVPTRASLAVKTKGLLFGWLAHLNDKSNVCRQISSLLIHTIRLLSNLNFHDVRPNTFDKSSFCCKREINSSYKSKLGEQDQLAGDNQ